MMYNCVDLCNNKVNEDYIVYPNPPVVTNEQKDYFCYTVYAQLRGMYRNVRPVLFISLILCCFFPNFCKSIKRTEPNYSQNSSKRLICLLWSCISSQNSLGAWINMSLNWIQKPFTVFCPNCQTSAPITMPTMSKMTKTRQRPPNISHLNSIPSCKRFAGDVRAQSVTANMLDYWWLHCSRTWKSTT